MLLHGAITTNAKPTQTEKIASEPQIAAYLAFRLSAKTSAKV